RVDPRVDGVPATQTIAMHAVRLWDRVFAVWRVHTEADVLYDQLLHAERIAGIGSFCWELRDAEPRCSPELIRMFHGGNDSGSVLTSATRRLRLRSDDPGRAVAGVP